MIKVSPSTPPLLQIVTPCGAFWAALQEGPGSPWISATPRLIGRDLWTPLIRFGQSDERIEALLMEPLGLASLSHP